MDFFKFSSTEFAAYSKPPSRDNCRKASYPRTQQRDRVRVKPRSCDLDILETTPWSSRPSSWQVARLIRIALFCWRFCRTLLKGFGQFCRLRYSKRCDLSKGTLISDQSSLRKAHFSRKISKICWCSLAFKIIRIKWLVNYIIRELDLYFHLIFKAVGYASCNFGFLEKLGVLKSAIPCKLHIKKVLWNQ